MTALLERLNASRRFARSVYASHKLALRQSVPSALRAVGVTAPAAPVSSASRSVAPWALSNIAPRAASVMPVATRDAAPLGAVLRPRSSVLEPQLVTNLEPQGSANLEPQGSANLEPQGSANLEPQQEPAFLTVSAPLESVPLESAQEQNLELAAPPSELPELDGDVIAQALTAQTPLEQPLARAALTQADSSDEPVAPAMRATESQPPATIALAALAVNPSARAIAASLGLVRETREHAPILDPLPELERVEDASPMSETLAASPVQPQLAAPDPQVAEAALTAQDATTLEAAMLEASPASIAFEPELIAPSVAATNLEVAAPSVADEPAPSPDPIQTPARGRVIEEFQARPPRNMPPRNQSPRAAEPEPATVSATPQRPPEEWARLLRQRFAQPGDEAFNNAVTPAAPTALEAASSHSSPPAASSKPSANIVAPLAGQAAASSTSAEGSSDAQIIRERSLAALQAIPEDMTKRSPREWGLALIRRYTSADEAAAIGIEAYRDPNDAAATQTPPSEPAQSVAPRTTVPGPVPSSSASSSPEQAVPIVSDAAAHSARRFVAPRIVSSTASGLGTVAPSLSAQPVQPASAQRSAANSTPLEQSGSALEAAPPIPAPLEPNRPAIASDSSVDAPLETVIVTAPQTAAALDSAVLDNAQLARAAITASSDASPSANPSPSIAQNDTALPIAPPLEPVRLSGATRRFLEPLVGFDPNEVSVYTGEDASRVTRDLRADAAAQHGAVLLPDASNLETPAQLGLLAHELIHVAQQQRSAPAPNATLEPALESPVRSALESTRPFEAVSRRFVPAVGSSDTRSPAPSSSAGQPDVTSQFSNPKQSSNAVWQSSAPINQGISNFTSEEDRARTAEARVTQIARTAPLSSMPASAEPTNAPASWNGLPAPWESLPSLESSPSDDGVVSLIGAGLSPQGWGGSATTTNPSGYGGSVSSSNPAGSNGSTSSSSTSSVAQAAEIGRELPAEASGAAAAPDLEQLAKQVYDVLKRRLQSDRRRGGL